MTAQTPNATAHADLRPGDSRFVDVGAMAWEATDFPGVEFKTLLVDPASGMLTALLRMAPGTVLPDHEHVRIEQTYVLEGSLEDAEGTCTAGNFVWRPAGSRHEAWAPQGGLYLAIFQVPNRFFAEGGTVRDMLGRDWEAHWGESANLGVAG